MYTTEHVGFSWGRGGARGRVGGGWSIRLSSHLEIAYHVDGLRIYRREGFTIYFDMFRHSFVRFDGVCVVCVSRARTLLIVVDHNKEQIIFVCVLSSAVGSASSFSSDDILFLYLMRVSRVRVRDCVALRCPPSKGTIDSVPHQTGRGYFILSSGAR